MEFLFTKPWLRAFSGLFTNLAAAWFAVAFITPNFTNSFSSFLLVALTKDIAFGIICLVATVKIEEILEQ